MKIVLLSDGAKIPTRANGFAAGMDLYAPKDFTVNPGRNVMPLDIKIELDFCTEAQIRPRSGFSLKGMEGCVCENCENVSRFDADVLLGTIDQDYRGNVGVIIKSNESTPFVIKKGTRIAQMVISRYYRGHFELVDELTDTERGEEGFGHTGTN